MFGFVSFGKLVGCIQHQMTDRLVSGWELYRNFQQKQSWPIRGRVLQQSNDVEYGRAVPVIRHGARSTQL